MLTTKPESTFSSVLNNESSETRNSEQKRDRKNELLQCAEYKSKCDEQILPILFTLLDNALPQDAKINSKSFIHDYLFVERKSEYLDFDFDKIPLIVYQAEVEWLDEGVSKRIVISVMQHTVGPVEPNSSIFWITERETDSSDCAYVENGKAPFGSELIRLANPNFKAKLEGYILRVLGHEDWYDYVKENLVE